MRKNTYSYNSKDYSYCCNLEEMKICGLTETAERIGGGGTIFWSMDNNSIGQFANHSVRPSAIGLAHELGHAYDGVNGNLYPPDEYDNYNPRYKNILKSEWNAVFHENMIRKDLKIPLRQYYYQQEDENGLQQGSGYRMTNKNNPVRYVPFSSSKPKRANE
ncbi:MAG: hypothetical protein J6L73_01730 [Muribaculaceae bacterium]|nr:hypothetical protein [Muribaculaceae bacterium]